MSRFFSVTYFPGGPSLFFILLGIIILLAIKRHYKTLLKPVREKQKAFCSLSAVCVSPPAATRWHTCTPCWATDIDGKGAQKINPKTSSILNRHKCRFLAWCCLFNYFLIFSLFKSGCKFLKCVCVCKCVWIEIMTRRDW